MWINVETFDDFAFLTAAAKSVIEFFVGSIRMTSIPKLSAFVARSMGSVFSPSKLFLSASLKRYFVP